STRGRAASVISRPLRVLRLADRSVVADRQCGAARDGRDDRTQLPGVSAEGMMTAEVQHGFASFQPRARLLKLIGAELISDEVVAVTELVKNAHDADASWVTVRFVGAAEQARIEVIDDGFGMDRETLLGGWMEPAGTTKIGPSRRVTSKG